MTIAVALACGCNVLVGFPDRELAADDAGAPDAPVVDAATDAADAGDARESSDAGDANEAGPPPTFCAGQASAPWFCEDFEEGSPLAHWSGIDGAGAGTVAVVTSKAAPPDVPGHALEVSNAPDASQIGIDLHMDLGTAYTIQRFSFDVYLDVEPAEVVYIAEIDSADRTTAMLAYVYPGKLAFQERVNAGIKTPDHVSTIPIPTQTWTRVEMTLALSNTNASTFTAKVNGTSVVDPVTLDAAWKVTDPKIYLGYNYVNGPPVTAKSFFYDNVVLDSK